MKDEDYDIRPSTMGGRVHYGEQKDINVSSNHCEDKIRRYKRALKLRERQLNKAMNMIRKHQLSELFVQEYVKNSEIPVPKEEIVELLQNDDTNDDKLHLAVLYASPLGYEVPDGLGSTTFKVIQELNFQNDIAQITNALEGGK